MNGAINMKSQEKMRSWRPVYHAIGNKLGENLPHVRMSWNAMYVRMYVDRSQKPLSMRELFPPLMLQNGGRQIRFCHVVSRPASLLAENFSLKTWAQWNEQLFLFV